jgi:hypothetical protein
MTRSFAKDDSVRHAADAALGIIRHHIVWVNDSIGNGLAGYHSLFDPSAEFGLIPWILIKAGVTLAVISSPIHLDPWREQSAVWAGRQADGENAVRPLVPPLLQGSLDFPIDVTATMSAASDKNNRHG